MRFKVLYNPYDDYIDLELSDIVSYRGDEESTELTFKSFNDGTRKIIEGKLVVEPIIMERWVDQPLSYIDSLFTGEAIKSSYIHKKPSTPGGESDEYYGCYGDTT